MNIAMYEIKNTVYLERIREHSGDGNPRAIPTQHPDQASGKITTPHLSLQCLCNVNPRRVA